MFRIRTGLALLALLCIGPAAPERPAGSKPATAAQAPRVQAAARSSTTTLIKRTPQARKAPARRAAAKVTPRAAFPIAAVPSADGDRLALRDGPVSATFTDRGIALALTRKMKDAKASVEGLLWNLVGARQVAPRAEGQTSTRVHNLSGDRSRWNVHQPGYSQVVYDQVRPGIDVVVEARPKGLKYTLRTTAGGPRSIPIRYEGARDIRSIENGAAIEISTAGGSLREDGLICWQEGPKGRTPVAARYATAGGDSYSIELGDVDPSRPVVIDPTIGWSTYLGGSDNQAEESATSVAVDVDGNVYVAGSWSASDFPTTPPAPLPPSYTLPGSFLAKFAPDGTVVWVTNLGSDDTILSLAVDAAGKLVFTGYTHGYNFPLVNAADPTFDGQEAFVLQLTPDGSDIVFSTFLGGTGIDAGTGVAYDADGNVLVSGYTNSDLLATDGMSYGGGVLDGFAAKYFAGGELAWAVYLGGAEQDAANGVAADPNGNVYVTGYTGSTNFPIVSDTPATPPFQTVLGGGFWDAFVLKLLPTGELKWSSYLGGAGSEFGQAIAVSDAGEACVTGDGSSEFPIHNAFQPTTLDGSPAFVVKMKADGTLPVWSTHLGGDSSAFGRGIAVSPSGDVTVAGFTWASDFPLLEAVQHTPAGSGDVFVTRFAADGQSLRWSTYLGGSEVEYAFGVALAPDGGTIVVGHTQSADFPTANAFSSALAGGAGDAFVVRLSPKSLVPGLDPYDLAQLQLETMTPIEVGAVTTPNVLFAATIGGAEDAFLEVEVIDVDNPFTGTPTSSSSDPVPPGTVVYQAYESTFFEGISYQWRARQVSVSGIVSEWVSFGDNAGNPPAPSADPDFIIGFDPPPLYTPVGLSQRREDETIIAVGAVAPDRILLSAVITGGEDAWLELEVIPVDQPFSGHATSSSPPVSPGTLETHFYEGFFTPGVAYHWRARQVSSAGASEWVSFGGNADDAPDFVIYSPPPVADPVDLGQFRVADGTPIAIGGSAQNVFLRLTVGGDEDAGTEIEVAPVGASFTGEYTSMSDPLPPGTVLDHDYQGLFAPGAYHWRARQVTANGASPWVSFGGNADGDPDFVIAGPPPVATPVNLGQFRTADGTPVEIGGSAQNVFLRVTIDGTEDAETQIEAVPVGTPFTGEPTSMSIPLPPGTVVNHDYQGVFAPGVAVQWRARQVTASGASAWVSFGGNAENPPAVVADPDFVIGGVQTIVPPPVGLTQAREDGTPIAVGGSTQGRVLFSAVIAGTENATMELEIVRIDQPFTGLTTSVAGPFPPGTVASHLIISFFLSGSSYQWRARQATATGVSEWVTFGGNATGAADFTVDDAPPTLQVLRPKKDERTIGTATISVEGVASDNVLVSSVTWTNLTTGQSGVASGTTTWSAGVPLIHGDNEIRIEAVDHVGLTATSTLQIRRP